MLLMPIGSRSVRVFFRQGELGGSRLWPYQVTGDDNVPLTSIKEGSLEYIISKVLKVLYGLGNPEKQEHLFFATRDIIASLDSSDQKTFFALYNPSIGLLWDGMQRDSMEAIFLRISETSRSVRRLIAEDCF